MPQLQITATEYICGVHSFTEGFVKTPRPRIKNDRDALAFALWLERHGREKEAIAFLERYCASP